MGTKISPNRNKGKNSKSPSKTLPGEADKTGDDNKKSWDNYT